MAAPTSPPPRQAHSAAYDATTQAVVLFGGNDSTGPVADTWVWKGASWRRLALPLAPQARDEHSMASDTTGHVVLFGGRGLSGPLADTWRWDGSRWARSVVAGPSAREQHAMAYDSVRGRTVLFGGRNGQALGDTWEWDGSAWSQLSPAHAPPARFGHAMAWDAMHQRVVLFGGSPGPTNDTWEWDGNDWQQLQPVGAVPGPRDGHAMALDASVGKVVLFGGDQGGALGDTWEWDGTGWARSPSYLKPPARSGHVSVTAADGQPLMFGGFDGQLRADTWRFASPLPASYVAFGQGCGGTPAPDLSAVSPPRLGQRFDLLLRNLPSFRAGVLWTGLSDQQFNGLALPYSLGGAGMPGCSLLVSGDLQTLVLVGGGGTATWGFTMPNNAFLAGAEFYNQAFIVDPGANPAGVIATNGGHARVGVLVDPEIVEYFVDNRMLDPDFSSGSWGAGRASPGGIGFDGLHGDFDPALGVELSPQVYQWSTDSFTVPASRTLSGKDELVTDGVFRFSRLVVPAGVTVRFVGSHPARLFVRGTCRIDGTLDLSAPTVPLHGPVSIAQPGGAGGAGGGQGGRGADAADGQGAQPRFNGQDGDDVQLVAGHAYAMAAAGTGGRGSQQYPTSGLNSSVTFNGLSNLFSSQVPAGGGGGGFSSAGQPGLATFSVSNELGPAAPGGSVLGLLPVPSSTSHLDHFLAGGAGGGGSASTAFFATASFIEWRAGSAGGGGGGALAVRAGGRLGMGPNGRILAVGGSTSDVLAVVHSAPGGGGSGGSVLLQAPRLTGLAGVIDVRGGRGGAFDDPVVFQVKASGGDGGNGAIRLETQGSPSLAVLGTTQPPAAAGSSAVTAGGLTDSDAVTGQQSRWYPSQRATPPQWVRYEVDATVGGAPVRFSDDPAVGALAGAGQAVQLMVQGARLDALGQVDPTTIKPWRAFVGNHGAGPSLDGDGATVVRFALLFDRGVAQSIAVTRVAFVLR